MKRKLGLLLAAGALAGLAWLAGRGEDSGLPASPVPSIAASGELVQGRPEVAPLAVEVSEGRSASEAAETGTAQVADEVEAAPAYFVAGVVLDEAGLPIEDAVVFIGAAENPFAGTPEDRLCQWGDYTGLQFPVAPDGRFRVVLPGPQSVYVCPDTERSATEWTSESEAWVTPPREDLVLELCRVPYATLAVRVVDDVEGRYLDSFQVRVSVEGKTFFKGRAKDGLCEVVLRTPPGGRTFEVELLSPAAEEPDQATVHLQEGETREVLLQARSGRIANGIVTDASGLPIEGVLVYFGDLTTVVPDELAHEADPGRAQGVRTDDLGQFQLTGGLAVVTFWHPLYRSTTLPASSAMRVALGRRGRIVGCTLAGFDPGQARIDGEGLPTVIPDGSFAFEHVDAGFHMVELPGVERLSVILESDETVALDCQVRVDEAFLRLHAAGAPLEGEFQGALVGLAPVASLVLISASDGTAPLGRVIPGEYLLWAYGGHCSMVSIEGMESEADIGSLQLTVRSARGGSFTLLPPAASPLPLRIHDLVARGATGGSEVVFGPLAPGQYVLREIRSGTEWSVELTDSRVLDVP